MPAQPKTQQQPSNSAPPQARQTSQAPAQQARPQPSSQRPPEQSEAPRPLQGQARTGDRAPPRTVPGHDEVKASNPFANQAERRAKAVESLRAQRGGKPAETRSEPTPPRAEVKNAQAAQKEPDGPGGTTPATPEAKAADPGLATLQKQYEEREAVVRAAEAKVREAHTAAEKRAAEAEVKEANAATHLKRLEMLRGDPAQFLAEAGISEEEFKRYLATGGKPTGEQQRLSETEKQLAAMRAEVEKVRAEAASSVATLRREREDSEFARELANGDYALVREMGGLGAVRAKQEVLVKTLGKDVTLADAAGQLENEWRHGFTELLKRDKVRATLGLDATTPVAQDKAPEASKAPSPRTLNGSLSSATSPATENLAWNDWRGKKERILRDMARSRGN